MTATTTITRAQLAQMVDHTLLKAEATSADVAAHCQSARELGVFSVCISPSFLPLATDLLPPEILVCTVVGFPSGKHKRKVKSGEAGLAVEQGADEVDMVIDVGAIRAGQWRFTAKEVAAVRRATTGRTLKVILETAALSDDQIVRACITCKEAGADFVKTSTGFHPAGGASAHAISLMSQTVGATMGIKASGGIRTTAAALEMIQAGATRLGLSGTAAVLDGLDSPTGARATEPGSDGGY